MLYEEIHCYDCKTVTPHYNGKCGNCTGRKQRENREKYDADCQSKTLEQRIKSLEDWRYNSVLEENQSHGFDL